MSLSISLSLLTDLNLSPTFCSRHSPSNSSYNTDCTLSDDSKDDIQPQQPKTKHQITMERRHKNFEVKKKTELCRTFQLGLECPYGNKCSFAHGYDEIRAKVLVPAKYKTALCQQYFTKEFCNYGPRCQFLHRQQAPQPKISIGYQKVIEAFGLGMEYKELNGESGDALDGVATILDKTINLSKFNLKPLNVFKKCLANPCC